MPLSDHQIALTRGQAAQFSGLKALFINCTLKSSAQGHSHTETLMKDSMELMERCGVAVDYLRAADHAIAFGVQPDMREHGAARDDWPEIFWPKVKDAHILVIGTPLWLGEESSICRVVIERLYAHSAQRNAKGQYVFYGKTGGAIITGNEDGIKHASMTCLFAMQHVGYTIPPQADCGWIGEAGPGPSYGDETRRRRPCRVFQRFHAPQPHLHDVQPDAHGQNASRCRRHPRPRQHGLSLPRQAPSPEPR